MVKRMNCKEILIYVFSILFLLLTISCFIMDFFDDYYSFIFKIGIYFSLIGACMLFFDYHNLLKRRKSVSRGAIITAYIFILIGWLTYMISIIISEKWRTVNIFIVVILAANNVYDAISIITLSNMNANAQHDEELDDIPDIDVVDSEELIPPVVYDQPQAYYPPTPYYYPQPFPMPFMQQFTSMESIPAAPAPPPSTDSQPPIS